MYHVLESTRNSSDLHEASGFPSGLEVKNPPANARDSKKTQVPSLDQEDPLEEGMTTQSSTLAWRIPWTEEPGGLQSIGSQRVGDD